MSQEQPARQPVLINTDSRPRLLVRGFDDEPTLVEALLALGPTSKKIASLREIRQAEWDVLVTDRQLHEPAQDFGEQVGLADHICVVYRAAPQESYAVIESRDDWTGRIRLGGRHISRELHRIPDLPQRIADLTHEQLEPVAKERNEHVFFTTEHPRGATVLGSGTAKVRTQKSPAPGIEPFLTSADARVLAGRYRRRTQAEAWLLPADVPSLVAWVRAALAEWHELNPESFPGLPGWTTQDQWATPAEISKRAALAELADERTRLVTALDEREGRLRAELDSAKDAGDAYERRLLTAQDDALTAAVDRAFAELGFEVTDSDATANPRDKLEDLQLRDPDAPDWVALGEVKGYTKGAKTEAIAQFMRHQKRFQHAHGRMADSEWYVVNQFLGRDPGTRQKALAGSPDDLEAFGAGGGLIIDTVVLFRLLMDVRAKKTTAKAARQRLRRSTGRIDL